MPAFEGFLWRHPRLSSQTVQVPFGTRGSTMTLRLFVASFVLFAAGSAHAYCRLTTDMPTPGVNCADSGIGLTWRRQCISFSMMQRTHNTPDFESIRDVADESFATWEEVGCEASQVGLSIRQTAGLGECDDPEYNPDAPNANTIIFVNDWAARDLPSDAFGLTLVWHNPDTGEIYDADMQLNETLGEFGICAAVCPNDIVDLQNVITHEAGHFLGLGHSAESEATMSARATVGETRKRDLDEDDRAGLCAIYGDDPPAQCDDSDYFPDNGFSPRCFAGQSQTKKRGLCSVSAAGGGEQALAPAGLFAVAAFGLALRRRRARKT
jgi:MYXO-CTERM domain-containing protein